MSTSRKTPAAIVVLPAVRHGRLGDPGLRGWLARSSVRSASQPNALAAILRALDLPLAVQGLAALRMWGQTGERPGVWIAAADPVYLEPRLDHLCLHALGPDSVSVADLRGIFDALQGRLAQGAGFGFARIGKSGYLRAAEPIATASEPALAIDRQPPDAFLPEGREAAGFRGLISEVEMVLHDHEVNERRQAAGLPPINSLWFWGGGTAPEPTQRPLPPLFASDPLVCGYWLANSGAVAEWPGSVDACIEAAGGDFVAEPTAGFENRDLLQSCLRELRDALRRRRVSRLVLLFRDGVEARARRSDRFRFWRRRNALFE